MFGLGKSRINKNAKDELRNASGRIIPENYDMVLEINALDSFSGINGDTLNNERDDFESHMKKYGIKQTTRNGQVVTYGELWFISSF